jgi:hypothetical protein
MIGGIYFAGGWFGGMTLFDKFEAWFAMAANKVVGWRIQQV